MPSLGSNDITVRIGSQADTSGIDKTSGSINKLEGDSGGAGRGLAVMGTAATAAVAGIAVLGAGVAALSIASIKAAGDFEANRVAFDVMLGSADKASQLMTQIAAFAKTTPFELPDVVSGAKKLLAYGFAQNEIIKTMSALGDVSAGVGVNFGELVDIYGKARTQGTLFTEDFDQFTGRGIPLAKALSKELGVAPEKVRALASEGKITFPVLEKGFQEMTKSGSQFGGMMEKQSQTFNGVMSNLSDGFQAILRHAAGMDDAGNIIKGGFFDRVKDAANAMMPVLQQAGDRVGGVITWFLKIADVVGAYFKPMFDEAALAVQAFGAALGGEGITTSGDKLVGMAERLGVYVKELGEKFVDLWHSITGKDSEFAKKLMDGLKTVWYVNIVLVLGVIALLVDAIRVFFDVGQGLVDFFQDTAKNWEKGTNDANQFITNFFNNIISLIQNLPENIGYAIGLILQTLINFVQIDLPNFIGSAIHWFSQLPLQLGAMAANLWNGSSSGFDSFNSNVLKWAQDTVNGIIQFFVDLPSKINKAITGAFNGAVSTLNDFFSGVSKGAKAGKRATGGPVTAGMPYIVGDNPDGSLNSTSELFVPNTSGQIVNNRDLRSMMGGASGGNIYVTNNINNQVDYDKGIMQLGFMLRTR